ncbi:MAG: (2Fe-2S)-binding protein [Deltaproteobacteria bacterium]|nr:(2Fe-2S)-binding protein [Deltaproteobacteria bacterium]
MGELRITVDGAVLTAEPGSTLIDVARAAGIYVPYLCSHPELPVLEPGTRLGRIFRSPEEVGDTSSEDTYEGCWLCAVEVDGALARACTTEVVEGMAVDTRSEMVTARRRQRLAELLAENPHLCPACARDEGLLAAAPPPPPSSDGIGGAALFSLIDEAFAPPDVKQQTRRCPCCELRVAIEPSAVMPQKAPSTPSTADGQDDGR